ncbi:MAG: hypothetical protein R3D68_15520 [Hyphomicrobiaceae bacterium]
MAMIMCAPSSSATVDAEWGGNDALLCGIAGQFNVPDLPASPRDRHQFFLHRDDDRDGARGSLPLNSRNMAVKNSQSRTKHRPMEKPPDQDDAKPRASQAQPNQTGGPR